MCHCTMLSLLLLTCFLGVAYGMNCSLDKHDNFFAELKEIFTDSDCPPTTDCCMKYGHRCCCSIPEYLARDGFRFILPMMIAAAGIISLTVVSATYLSSNKCCYLGRPREPLFIHMV